jgi:competence ComEA-like helix-hairpin-helix protein
MKAKLKFFLYGTLLGVFISGLTIVLIDNGLTHFQSTEFYESSKLSLPPTDNSTFCHNSSSEIVSNSLLLDINLASLEELKTLPGIGDAKAKSIIDFRKKYGNFTSVDELLYVPGIGKSLFQQICYLVVENSKDNK